MKHTRTFLSYIFLGLFIMFSLPALAHGLDEELLMEKPTVANSDYESKILEILHDIESTQNYRNVPEFDGRLLRVLAEAMNAQNVVEVGTSNGYSTIWLGLALKKTGGTLITFEIDPERAANARENFKRADMNEIITLIEGDAHEKILMLNNSIDILFLDADKTGYVDYLEKALPLIRPGGMIIGHNIVPSMVDQRFLEAITTNPDLETVIRRGVSLSIKKR